MKIEYGNRKINIPDSTIQNYMDSLQLTKDKAIQMYLEEEGIEDNEELEALEKKAKENRITATIHGAEAEGKKQKKPVERKRKENPTKRKLIEAISKLIEDMAENTVVLNPEKLIQFNLEGNLYEIDLRQKRKKKEG